MTKILSILVLLTLAVSCIKTAEQVQREKRMESISDQMKDSQGLLADLIGQIKDMQSQLDKTNGRLEELEHRQGKVNPEQLNKMNESLTLLQTQQQAESTQLLQIQNELKEQRGFLEKVTASLGSMTKESAKPAKKKSAKGDLAEALNLVSKNEYKEARSSLESLIDHEDLSPGDKNKVLHGLGRVEFFTKNYDKALVYFSKIYTKFPKSSLAPGSLLYIGKTLDKMGKKDEAKEAYAKVVEDYPSSKEAASAKKEI